MPPDQRPPDPVDPQPSVTRTYLGYLKHNILVLALSIIFAIAWGAFWILEFVKSLSDTAGNTSGNILFGILAAVPILVIGVWLNRAHSKFQASLFQGFANKNNFQFLKKGQPYGQIQGERGQIVSDVISGTYSGFPFKLFLDDVFIGGSRASIEHELTILEFKLSSQMPHLVLVPKDAPLGNVGLIDSFAELLVNTFSSRTELSLEGDFASRFHLYGEKGQEVESLKIFNPDLMATVEDQAPNYIIELQNDSMSFYVSKYASTQQQLDQLLKTSQVVASKV